MKKEEVLGKIRKDALVAVNKLSQYRQIGDIQNYKSLSDSLNMLIRMNHDYTPFTNRVWSKGDNTRHYFQCPDDETIDFFKQITIPLNDELHLLSIELDSALQKNDVRQYRNLLISFEKLSEIQIMINDLFQQTDYLVK